MCGWREREVELETAGKQEDTVDGAAAWEVEELDRIKFLRETLRPPVKHITNGHAVFNREGQVEIRPTIARSMGQRADDGSCDDTRVGLGPFEHSLMNPLTVMRSEHRVFRGPKAPPSPTDDRR